jgi:hypothetical protein
VKVAQCLGNLIKAYKTHSYLNLTHVLTLEVSEDRHLVAFKIYIEGRMLALAIDRAQLPDCCGISNAHTKNGVINRTPQSKSL